MKPWCLNFRNYNSIFLLGLREWKKILSQDGWCPNQNSNQLPLEYKSQKLYRFYQLPEFKINYSSRSPRTQHKG
jgi:hypothetical protein